jgi:hypothetical protein
MKRFKSPEQAQRFLSVFDPIAPYFRTTDTASQPPATEP